MNSKKIKKPFDNIRIPIGPVGRPIISDKDYNRKRDKSVEENEDE